MLHPDIPTRDINIREDKEGKIFFTGAREEVVVDAVTAMYYLEQGNLNRSTAETLMNQKSSRSHAIFTVALEMLQYSIKQKADIKHNTEQTEDGSYIQAKLHLVDLAGSERAKRTGALGTRLKESVGINQGLLSLGKVIRALTNTPIGHIPYRESKLTRFLQDSLGGNSRTTMLACVSSSENDLHETIGTLQYAQRAKSVQNKVVANVSVGNVLQNLDVESTLVGALKEQIHQMQMEIARQATESTKLTPIEEDAAHVEKEKMIRVFLRVISDVNKSLLATTSMIDEHEGQRDKYYSHLDKVARDIIGLLREVLDRYQQHSSISHLNIGRKSLSDSLILPGNMMDHNSQNKLLIEEVNSLRQQLEECRDDLQRDEDIFAEKIKELKRYKRKVRELETHSENQKVEIVKLQDNINKLARVNIVGHGSRPNTTQFAENKTGSDDKAVSDIKIDQDDLDISIAVAATEPDISQLMEDLETIAKEKEGLEDFTFLILPFQTPKVT